MTIVSVKRLLQDLGGHQPWGQVASEKAARGRPVMGGGRGWDTEHVFITVAFQALRSHEPRVHRIPQLQIGKGGPIIGGP